MEVLLLILLVVLVVLVLTGGGVIAGEKRATSIDGFFSTPLSHQKILKIFYIRFPESPLVRINWFTFKKAILDLDTVQRNKSSKLSVRPQQQILCCWWINMLLVDKYATGG